jgi:hypothetical protein
MTPSVVIIARSELAAGWRKRFGADPAVALYSDCDSLRAMDAIVAHPPKILALDRGFGTTARGAALVARLKTDPGLCHTDVRVLIEDETNVPLLLEAPTLHFDAAVLKASYPIDYCGTRRAPRFRVDDEAEIVVNGQTGRLVNLSMTGAQLLLFARVRPDEAVRVALVDDTGEVKGRGVVAWSAAEPSSSGVRYRAGVEFTNTESHMLEAFCSRHTCGVADAAVLG